MQLASQPLMTNETHNVQSFNRGRLEAFDNAYRRPVVRPLMQSALATLVESQYKVNAEFRCSIGVQEQMEYCISAYNNQYDPRTAANIPKGRDVFVGITSLKCRAVQSWLQDILINAEDKPWTLSSTPQPQLPEQIEALVVQRLEQELVAGSISPEALVEMIPEIRSIANKHAQSLAAQANEGMQQRLLDLMLEGGWRKTYESVFVDISVYPAAVIRGPVVRMRPRMRWSGRELEEVREPQMVVERVSPMDFFPSPDSTTPQDGSNVIERMRMSRKDLIDCINTPGFSEQGIRAVLARRHNGTQWWADNGSNDEISKRRMLAYEGGQNDNAYKVLAFYGAIDNRMLIEHGVEVGDPHGSTEAEVWVCDGEVLRAAVNPRPLGRRPFDAARFHAVPGSFWGISLPQMIRDPQRVVNAAVRNLVGNMGLASGPILEMDATRMEDEPDPQNIFPWRVYMTRPDPATNSTAPAIRPIRIDSIANELQGIVQQYSTIIDDLSGVPAFAIGSPQTSGAGRTLGGLSMLLGNAARGIKRVISSMDKDMIEPLVTSLYYLEMMYGSDKSIKTDAQVVARGSSGLLQRQLNQTRAVELLQIMAPFFGVADGDGNALVPVQGLRRVLFDVVKSMGYTEDEVLPDPGRSERLQLLQAQAGAQQATQNQFMQPPPATPPPPLDGRSAPPPDVVDASVVPLSP